jgi:hypothetical protein
VNLLEALSELENLVSRGYELEAQGRMLATGREEFVNWADEIWFGNMRVWHKSARDFCSRLIGKIFTETEFVRVDALYEYAEEISTEFGDASRLSQGRAKRKDRMVVFTYNTGTIVDYLMKYDKHQSALSGRSGIWLYGRAMTLEEYTFSALYNDYTSCFHQFLNWLVKKIASIKEVANRVYAIPGATEIAVMMAKLWRDAVEVYNSWNLYSEEDYDALCALCRLNEIDFRVGSMEGHATHAVIRPLFSEATYYDTDESVHYVFDDLCSHYGLRVVKHIEGESTTVEIPRPLLRDFFQGVLPFVTTMDLRLSRIKIAEYLWSKEFKREFEELRDYPEEYREYKLCLKAYERFIKERR